MEPPKPILYGIKISPPVRSVLLVAKAIGLDLDFRDVNFMVGEHKTPSYLLKNPQHTIPTLEDDGRIIWDSHAIATYLIGKYAHDDSLYPKDLYKRALIDQRLHFDSGVLYVRFRNIVEDILFFNDPVIPQKKLDAVIAAYDFMEKFLATDEYLVGNSLTVADLCAIALISSIQGVCPVNSEKYPQLTAWMKRMEALPYYEEANGQAAKDCIEFLNNKIIQLSNQ